MPVVPPPQPLPVTFLWSFGFRFERVGNKFYDTYQDIKNIWLLGEYLAWPFFFLSTWFLDLRDYAWEANKVLGKYYLWIDQLVDGSLFRSILDYLSYNYKLIRIDPLGFIVSHLRNVSTHISQLLTDARLWFQNTFQSLFPTLYDVYTRPLWWVREKITQLFPIVISFLFSPIGVLTNWIHQYFPNLSSLILSPVGFIIDLICQYQFDFRFFLNNPLDYVLTLLRNFSPDLWAFIVNPFDYFRNRVCLLFGFSYDATRPFARQVLFHLLNNLLGTYGTDEDTMITLLCSIVIKFI